MITNDRNPPFWGIRFAPPMRAHDPLRAFKIASMNAPQALRESAVAKPGH
jgi:hypothetical protein